MSNQNTNNSNSISLIDLYVLAFVVLKIIGFVHSPWWLITAPYWAMWALAFIIAIVNIIWAKIKNHGT